MVSDCDSSDASTCAQCGGPLERFDENTLDIAGEEVTFYADRCSSCNSEFVNAPGILRSDKELISTFRPTASPLGSYRRIVTLASRDRVFRLFPGPKVAATILGYLLENDFADVALLAHQGVTEEPIVAFTKADVFRAGEIRMGSGRAVLTGSGLRANLLTLAQLKRFAETDHGLNPRIAVMGRPCQTYTVRKLLWDSFVPGYELAFALGVYCYGNFAPLSGGARKLRELLSFDPLDIRQVDFVGEELRFTSVLGAQCRVGQDAVAGLVNPNCLQCYDFSASFSDLSVGRVGPDEMFETTVVRTDRGEKIVNRMTRDGLLMTSAELYGQPELVVDERRAKILLEAMVEIKKQLTRNLR
jgi:coenzyme F420-reducing hydrogenase beta subunit